MAFTYGAATAMERLQPGLVYKMASLQEILRRTLTATELPYNTSTD